MINGGSTVDRTIPEKGMKVLLESLDLQWSLLRECQKYLMVIIDGFLTLLNAFKKL
jgi:hypothetical protein